MLYFQLSNVSSDCFSEAPTQYTFAPLSFRSSARPQASAAANSVLEFFRAMKINASWHRLISVPLW